MSKPLNGRNFIDLTLLQPGITQHRNLAVAAATVGLWFSSNGAPLRSNNYLLDGAPMTNLTQGTSASQDGSTLGIEGLREYRVITNSFSAEYGMTMGSQVMMVTKSGTNALHGSLFEYFRNNALDARNYFDNAPAPKAPFHNNQFGGSVGGPIVKDKTFFFLDYEGQRENVGVVSLDCVPTAAFIQQATATALASPSGLSPVGQKLLDFFPHNPANYIPGIAASDSGCFNARNQFAPDYIANAPSFNNLSSVIAKIHHTINSHNNLTGRYFFGDSTQQFPLAL